MQDRIDTYKERNGNQSKKNCKLERDMQELEDKITEYENATSGDTYAMQYNLKELEQLQMTQLHGPRMQKRSAEWRGLRPHQLVFCICLSTK